MLTLAKFTFLNQCYVNKCLPHVLLSNVQGVLSSSICRLYYKQKLDIPIVSYFRIYECLSIKNIILLLDLIQYKRRSISMSHKMLHFYIPIAVYNGIDFLSNHRCFIIFISKQYSEMGLQRVYQTAKSLCYTHTLRLQISCSTCCKKNSLILEY